ncbi:hypothetical protein K4K55_010757 [Colletotrichum sp. SAR 10_96]|nr:hypothetical protein K4K55_010757 [Colletotrichum sp. SAR 10_96]
MSDKRPQVASFAPEEKPEPVTLKRTRSGKIGTTYLPYEVFLHIVEALIEDVFDWEETVHWDLQYNEDALSKIVVQENDHMYYHADSQMIRFQRSRLPSQINRQTRHIVDRVLPRATRLDEDGTISPIDAWIRPDIDGFIFPICDAGKMRLYQALAHDHSLAPFIEHIVVADDMEFWITDADADDLDALATLPNLMIVQMDIGSRFTGRLRQPIHFGFRKINPEIFPNLAEWAEERGPAFKQKFLPLKENGVRLLCGPDYDPLVEVIDTEEGILLQLLDIMRPNCTCCKEDWIYRDDVQKIGVSEAPEQ